jgi:pimeloyl-ACP methyl ester carboxylesterase
VVLLHVAFAGASSWASQALRAEYDLISPDEPEPDLESLAVVGAPTLVLQGDRDDVMLEHGPAVAAALPKGRLAVLPGTHALPAESPGVVNALLLWFLSGGEQAPPAEDRGGHGQDQRQHQRRPGQPGHR